MTLTYVYVAVAVIVAALLVVYRQKVAAVSRDGAAWLTDVRSEIGKVTWPDKDQLRTMTFVILGFVAIVALIIFGLDVTLNWILVTLPGRSG